VVRLTQERGYAFPAEHSGGLAVAFPRSISWEELDQKAFNPIAEAIYALIEEAIGTSIETLKEKTKETI
jgi:hypothetical protein